MNVTSGLAVAVFVLLVGWGQWSARRQKRVLGHLRYRDCLATTRLLGSFSGRIATLEGLVWVFVAAGLLLLWYQSARGSSVLWSVLGLWFVITGLGKWAQSRVPASVLVLGSSGQEQISLQATIRNALVPFRPVSLLQTGKLSIDVRIPGDCYRIDHGIEWKEAVYALCRSVAVIVLDVRTVTDLVEDEVRHVSEAGHGYKALFIGPQQTGAPSARVADSESAVALLRYIFLEEETTPTIAVPISTLATGWRGGRHDPVSE